MSGLKVDGEKAGTAIGVMWSDSDRKPDLATSNTYTHIYNIKQHESLCMNAGWQMRPLTYFNENDINNEMDASANATCITHSSISFGWGWQKGTYVYSYSKDKELVMLKENIV